MQMIVLIFITGISQDDTDDGLCGNIFSLTVVSEQDFGLCISLVNLLNFPSSH